MPFDPGLQIGQVIDSRELLRIFTCSPQGGMRKSNRTNSLIITTNTKGVYHDRWDGDIIHYTGMGLIGDQKLTGANRTLSESKTNGVSVFLFEVIRAGHYTFRGLVNLCGEPYQDYQPDGDGVMRLVWMFPLRTISLTASIINEVDQYNISESFERSALRLSDQDLQIRAEQARPTTSQRFVASRYYERNPYVAEYAIRRANGICQLCLNAAPFNKKDGHPYLESHHIKWLANKGADVIENTVGLCPNCHRKMHVVNDPKDISLLNKRVRS